MHATSENATLENENEHQNEHENGHKNEHEQENKIILTFTFL